MTRPHREPPASRDLRPELPSVFSASPGRAPAWYLRENSPWLQIIAGLVVTGLAIGLRELLNPFLGDVKAYVYFVLPILLCGYLFGPLSGFIMAVGGFTHVWLRVEPGVGPTLDIDSESLLYTAAMHATIGAACVIAMDRLRDTQRSFAAAVAQKTRVVNLLDSLLDNSPLGTALYDRNRVRLRTNPKFLEVLELRPASPSASPMLGEDFPLAAAALEGAFKEVLKTHRAVEHLLVEIENPREAEVRYLSCSFFPVFDELTFPYGVAVLVNDQTDLRRSGFERDRLFELERGARREAEAAIRMKDEFVAMLSHELRTPLTAILGWSELMRAQAGDPTFVKDAADAIAQSTRAQMRMVEDLLDLSRVKTGRLHLDRDIVDLGDLVTDVVRNCRQSNGRDIQMDIAEECLVDGDYQRLAQVFSNIVENAVKYSKPTDAIRVRVVQEGNEVVTTVEDDGIGIGPEMLDSIFDRFRQGEAGSRRRYGGLGLGLAIVKELVVLHDGNVAARSEGLGKGSSFEVRLPAAVSARIPPISRTVTSEPVQLGEALGGYRVLLVDDDDQTRDVLKRMLTSVGAAVDARSSGIDGLEALGRQRYDVIVSDIAMPGMDGYEFLSQVRSNDLSGLENTPAIALSAYTRVKDRQAAFHAGFDAYLSKPVELAKLVDAIRDASRPTTSSR